MSEVMEIARFKFAQPVDAAHAAAGVERWLAEQPGYLSRMLLGPDAEGWYTDLVRWRSEADASRAMDRMAESEAAAAFMAQIDPTSVQMSHLPVILGPR